MRWTKDLARDNKYSHNMVTKVFHTVGCSFFRSEDQLKDCFKNKNNIKIKLEIEYRKWRKEDGNVTV